MKNIAGLTLLLFTVAINAYAQNMDAFTKKLFIRSGDTLPYRVLLPENYDASEKYPLIIVLHGAGERGNDNEKQLTHGAKLFLQPEVRKKHPAIVVFPQCPENSFWSNVNIRMENGKRIFDFKVDGEPTMAMRMAEQLVKKLLQDYRIEKKQVYVGGLSMGGMGTFELVRRMPGVFAAAFPICGGAHPATAQQIRKTTWWVFHGVKDDVVPIVLSEVMVNALNGVKASVKFTRYPEASHNSWDPAFAEPELLPWLFSQEK